MKPGSLLLLAFLLLISCVPAEIPAQPAAATAVVHTIESAPAVATSAPTALPSPTTALTATSAAAPSPEAPTAEASDPAPTDAAGQDLPASGTFVDGYGGDTFTGEDTILHSGATNINFGQHNVYEVSAIRKLIQRFDLSAIPAGSACVSARVYYYKFDAVPNRATNITLYTISQANAGWYEGAIYGGPGGDGDASWDYKDTGRGIPWAGSPGLSTPGVDYEPDPIGSFVIPARANDLDEFVAELDCSRVQGWFGPENTNYGILFIASDIAGYIGLSEPDITKRPVNGHLYIPKLVVEYSAAQ